MRNYSVLEDIYLGDIEKIEANKGKMDITLSECVFAVKCYSQSTNKLNFDIAKTMFDEYTEKHNSTEDINDLINLAKGISYNGEMFVSKMVKNEHIKKFLKENKFDTVEFINEDLRLDAITEDDKVKINTLIEIEGFKKVLQDHLPLEEVVNIIDLAKESSKIIIEKNSNTNGYAPLAVFVAEDVIETLVYNYSKQNNISSELWKNVKRYSLATIKDADLEEMTDFQGPQHLAQDIKEPIYEASWVLLENGDMKFASTYFGFGNHRGICHTDLANGETVVSAGMAYFSADKSKLLAIDNKSGHYQPSLESVYNTLPTLEKSNVDISDTIISDFGWSEPKPFKDNSKTNEADGVNASARSNDEVASSINKMRAKSFPEASLENRNIPKPNGK